MSSPDLSADSRDAAQIDTAPAGYVQAAVPLVAGVYQGVERRRVKRSQIAETQRKIPLLEVPLPDSVPSALAIAACVPDTVRAFCAAGLAAGPLDFAGAIEALEPYCGGQKRKGPDLAVMMETGETSDALVFDHFFRIVHVENASPALYLQSQFRALQVLYQEVRDAPSDLSDAKLEELALGPQGAIAAALGISGFAPFTYKRTVAPHHADYPAWRWIRGHQLFTALTQALIFAFNALDTATMADELAAVATAATTAATLLRASARSLELTGDYSTDAYNDLIRVSMGTPFQPDGFSGLLSDDHRHLVRRMKAMRPTMDLLKQRDPDRFHGITSALGEVYESHKFVCSRFVGADRTSLLMNKDIARSAVDQLDKFKAARMKSIGVDAPQTRT